MSEPRSPFFEGTFRATEKSLDIAAEVARLVGQSFDLEETSSFVGRLHRTYYDNIVKTLGLSNMTIGFASGNSRQVAAFVPRQSTIVHFDEHLDFWTFTLTHLLTVSACKVLSVDERSVLLKLFHFVADPVLFPSRYSEARERLLPWIRQHSDCLELSHALSRGMIVFIICHEIAHTVLGHTRIVTSKTHEFKADALAVEYFRRIQQEGTNVEWIFVHQKVLCAPILLLRLVSHAESIVETRTGTSPNRESHPAPSERAGRIGALLSSAMTDGCKYVLDSFSAALDDIVADLGLESRGISYDH